MTMEERAEFEKEQEVVRDKKVKQLDKKYDRPVFAILTEPMRGEIEGREDIDGYIPKAHVQFVEQSGIRLIPLSFRASQ